MSSNPSGADSSVFYVDGNFSPAQSGSPILNINSGNVIGVVSRSAGDPRFKFVKIEKYTKTLNFLTERTNVLSDLFTSVERLHRELKIDWNIPSDYFHFLKEGQLSHHKGEISEEILETLREIGVELREMSHYNIHYVFGNPTPDEKPTIDTVAIVGFDKIMRGIISIISEIVSTIEEVVDDTYQMGVGLARGGKPIIDYIHKNM